MDKREYKSIIESVLFVWAEPIHIDELCKVLDLEKKMVRELINEIIDEGEHYRRGIVLNKFDDYYQFSSRRDHDEYISKLVTKKAKQISNSAMETLAIIAYKQPITRVEVDNIRGVKSYASIDTLLSKGLIKEVGRLDKIGKPILFGTTPEFLRAFDISSLTELPIINNLEKLNPDDEDEN
ncbi:MAG: SMC-Scp complex subunit ScpB [Tissierellia bacterium]|nr:SMC-Scp complex subunit ScpB [Tissierellia bacterium]